MSRRSASQDMMKRYRVVIVVEQADLNSVERELMKQSITALNVANVYTKPTPEARVLGVRKAPDGISYVFPAFRGAGFEHLKSLGVRIFSSLAIVQSVSENSERALPDLPHPIMATYLYNKIIAVTGFPFEMRDSLRVKVELLGGTYSRQLSANTDYLIAVDCTPSSSKYRAAVEFKIPVVLPQFLDRLSDAALSGHTIPPPEVMNAENFYVPIFKNCVITVSGMETSERMKVMTAVSKNGGVFSADMNRGVCTHLIVNINTGQKYKKAVEWGGIHIVTFRWLLKCLKHSCRVDESKFSPVPKTSTQITDPSRNISIGDVNLSAIAGPSNASTHNVSIGGSSLSVSRASNATIVVPSTVQVKQKPSFARLPSSVVVDPINSYNVARDFGYSDALDQCRVLFFDPPALVSKDYRMLANRTSCVIVDQLAFGPSYVLIWSSSLAPEKAAELTAAAKENSGLFLVKPEWLIESAKQKTCLDPAGFLHPLMPAKEVVQHVPSQSEELYQSLPESAVMQPTQGSLGPRMSISMASTTQPTSEHAPSKPESPSPVEPVIRVSENAVPAPLAAPELESSRNASFMDFAVEDERSLNLGAVQEDQSVSIASVDRVRLMNMTLDCNLTTRINVNSIFTHDDDDSCVFTGNDSLGLNASGLLGTLQRAAEKFNDAPLASRSDAERPWHDVTMYKQFKEPAERLSETPREIMTWREEQVPLTDSVRPEEESASPNENVDVSLGVHEGGDKTADVSELIEVERRPSTQEIFLERVRSLTKDCPQLVTKPFRQETQTFSSACPNFGKSDSSSTSDSCDPFASIRNDGLTQQQPAHRVEWVHQVSTQDIIKITKKNSANARTVSHQELLEAEKYFEFDSPTLPGHSRLSRQIGQTLPQNQNSQPRAPVDPIQAAAAVTPVSDVFELDRTIQIDVDKATPSIPRSAASKRKAQDDADSVEILSEQPQSKKQATRTSTRLQQRKQSKSTTKSATATITITGTGTGMDDTIDISYGCTTVATPRTLTFTAMQPVEREELEVVVNRLNGVCHDDTIDVHSTHYLVAKKIMRNPKTLLALIIGRRIVSPKFITESGNAGHWLDVDFYEYGNPKARSDVVAALDSKSVASVRMAYKWRLQREVTEGGLFEGWRVLVFDFDSRASASKSLIEAGGGQATIAVDDTESIDFKSLTHAIVNDGLQPPSDLLNAIKAAGISIYNVDFVAHYVMATEKAVVLSRRHPAYHPSV